MLAIDKLSLFSATACLALNSAKLEFAISLAQHGALDLLASLKFCAINLRFE